jgi:hypothetical protein
MQRHLLLAGTIFVQQIFDWSLVSKCLEQRIDLQVLISVDRRVFINLYDARDDRV